VGAIDFQDYWAGLALKSLSEEEKLLPLSLLWALESIYCQSRKDLFGSSLSGWIEFQDYWAGLALKSLSGISVQSRYDSSGITTRNQSAVEFTFPPLKISRRLSRWYIQVAECRRVQSRYVSSGISTASLSVVELIHSLTHSGWIELIFRTFEPVLHWSRSVESVEASNLGMFPVESVLLAYQWLNWSTDSLTAVKLNWFSGRLSRSYIQVAVCVEASNPLEVSTATATATRSISGGIGSNHQLTIWFSGQLNLSCIQVA